MKAALELLKKHLTSVFIEKNSKKAIQVLRDDVHIYGVEKNAVIEDIQQARQFYDEEILRKYEKYVLKITDECSIDYNTAEIGFVLRCEHKEVTCRVTAVSKGSECENKLFLIHFSACNNAIADWKRSVQEQVLESLINNVPGGVCLYRWDGKKLNPIVISQAFSTLMGTDGRQLMEETDGTNYEVVHPDDLPGLQLYMNDVLNRVSSSGSYKYRVWNEGKKDYIWISAHGKVIQQSDGTSLIYITYEDETEQEEIQNQLIDSRNATSIAISHGHLGLWSYDLITKRLVQEYGNERAYGYGFVAENVPDSYIDRKVIHPEDAENYRKMYQEVMEGAELSKCLARVFDQIKKKYCWMRIVLVRQKDVLGRHPKVIGFSIDVNEERQYIDMLTHSQNELLLTQRKLRQNEALSDAANRFTGLWTFGYDIGKSIIYPNNSLRETFVIPEQLENYPESFLAFDYILPDYKQEYKDAVARIQKGANEVEMVLEMKYSDESLHWVRIRINRISNEQNEDFAIGTAMPIDQEKALEARIEVERQKTDAYDPDLLRYVIVNVTQDKVVEYRKFRNDIANVQAGGTLEDIIQDVIPHAIQDEKLQEYEKVHNREYLISLCNKGTTTLQIEGRHLTSQNDVLWVSNTLNLLRDPANNDIYLYEYTYDINKKKMQEEIIHAAINLGYERIAVLLPATGILIRAQENHEQEESLLSKHNFEKACKEYCSRCVLAEEQDDFLKKMSIKEIRTNVEANGEYEILHRVNEGGTVRIKRTCFAKFDIQNPAIFMTRIDITDTLKEEERQRLELQKATEEAQKANQAKTDFLALMSHDMRTPINTIVGLQTLALNAINNPTEIKDYLEKMHGATDFMLSIINDLLDLHEIENGKVELHKEPYRYNQFLDNINTMFIPQCENKGIALSIAKTNLNPIVLTDKMKLNRIFFNIFSNAVKYTPEGGCIKYYEENVEIRDNHLSVDFVISDNGIGMSEEFQMHMFDIFAQENKSITSKLQGSGVGLSITKQYVDLMEGTIQIHSQKNKGTTVVISLTFELFDTGEKQDYENRECSEIVTSDTILKGKNILVVEDHLLNAKIVKMVLEMEGIHVILAENGQIAVNKFDMSETGFFHAVLMDIRMPVMDGLEATRKIRALDRPDAQSVPIIALSANAYEEDVEKSLQAGMNFHLAKPVESEQLFQTLVKYISINQKKKMNYGDDIENKAV